MAIGPPINKTDSDRQGHPQDRFPGFYWLEFKEKITASNIA